MTEEWRDVVGLEGRYEVSSEGRLRSVSRVIERKDGSSYYLRGRVLKLFPGVGDYLGTVVPMNGKPTNIRVHVALAAAFLGPRPEGMVTRHLDGDPQHNTPANLAYGTHAENVVDTIRHGRHRAFSKIWCKYGHLLSGLNVADASAQKGDARMCVSCHRATSALRYRGKTRKSPEFLPLANSYYMDMLKTVAA